MLAGKVLIPNGTMLLTGRATYPDPPDQVTLTSPKEEFEWFKIILKECVVPLIPEIGLEEELPAPEIEVVTLAKSALASPILRTKRANKPKLKLFLLIML